MYAFVKVITSQHTHIIILIYISISIIHIHNNIHVHIHTWTYHFHTDLQCHVPHVPLPPLEFCPLHLCGREALRGPGEGLQPPAAVGEGDALLAGSPAVVRAEVNPGRDRRLADDGGALALCGQADGEVDAHCHHDRELVGEPGHGGEMRRRWECKQVIKYYNSIMSSHLFNTKKLTMLSMYMYMYMLYDSAAKCGLLVLHQ